MDAPTPLRLESVVCPSCGEAARSPVSRVRDHVYGVDRRAFLLVRCSACTLIYLASRPVRADLARAYPAAYLWNRFDLRRGGSLRDRLWDAWASQLVARRVRIVRRALGEQSDAALLDVGCGRALFLRAWSRRTGLPAHGVELQAETVAAVRAAHPRLVLHAADFLDWDGPVGGYGVVTMWHVLEHLDDPVLALRKAWRLLRPGGVLVVGTQNWNALSRRIQGDCWPLLDAPRHLVHFTPRTLRTLLEREGFLWERMHRWTEFYPILGAHLAAEWVLDPDREVRPLIALGCALALAPLEAVAVLAGRGCVMTAIARRP